MHAGADSFSATQPPARRTASFTSRDGVGGTGRHRGVTAVEHREIVVMIARGENRRLAEFREAGQFRQRRALVVIGVAKAQVNGVALVMKLRLLLPWPDR